MMELSEDEWRHAFPMWLRTGRLSSTQENDVIERKFNPWRDPEDCRFTFAGSGNYHGAGATHSAPRASKVLNRRKVRKPQLAGVSKKTRLAEQPNRAAEFAGGVVEGVQGVAQGTVEAVHSVLTTNPVTTVRNAGLGIASMIDTAITAEDTPAHIQVSRAADAVANASARDIGRATGSLVGNAALAVAPGAALGKGAALRRLRGATPGPTYDLPQFGWVKENLGADTAWRRYNDAAPGGRPGQAPTLMRTMPDGSKRPVKFDGMLGEYPVDRKWKVVTAPRARAQLLRQSEALAQNGMIGTWEVPSAVQKTKALKLLKEMSIANIKVRIVKP